MFRIIVVLLSDEPVEYDEQDDSSDEHAAESMVVGESEPVSKYDESIHG